MRYASIDVLRMFAIFVMVVVHFGENLSGHTSQFAGLGAPLFAFLSGVSYRLWVNVQEHRGKSDLEISKVSVRRGLFVFCVGFAFNVLVWLPEDVFNWDVLTFIGVGLLLLNGVRRLPLPVPVVLAVAALLVSPVLRDIADYQAYWQNPWFDPDWTFSDVLIGFLVTGYFPVFPWIAFPLAGFVTGSLLFAESTEPSESPPSLRPIFIPGACLLAMSSILICLRSTLPVVVSQKLLGGWTMFPPTIEYVLGTLGLTLMLLGLTHQYIDRNSRVSRYRSLLNISKTFSQYSFTIYVLHHIVHLWPLWVYAVAQGHEPTYYWTNAMPLSVSIPLAFAFLFCIYGILRVLGDRRSHGIESWMRWLCD